MKIVLSSNPYRDHGLRAALEAKRILEQAGAQTVLCLPFQPKKGDRMELPKKVELTDLHTALPAADLLICFGGDGTILHAARDATLHHVPILGVNMGSMGFMAELERGELSLLAPLARGDFATEERMMLDVRVLRGNKLISQDLALNDAVISKGSMARVAEMEVLADRGRRDRRHPHRLHRLLHVGRGAHRGAHLHLSHRHAGLRPPAGRPGHGAGPGPDHHRASAQRKPQVFILVN